MKKKKIICKDRFGGEVVLILLWNRVVLIIIICAIGSFKACGTLPKRDEYTTQTDKCGPKRAIFI